MTWGHPSAPVPLTDGHDLTSFDCGEPSLNDWLRNRAISNERSGASRSYVICAGNQVFGYYCLSTGGIDRDVAPSTLRRNMPDPIPILVLGRLGVDHRYQNQGLGRALLRDAIQRALQVAGIVGASALLVRALSEGARPFYRSSGFIELPSQPMTLCLHLRAARRAGAEPERS